MYNELLKLKSNNKLCAIYKNSENPDNFIVGYVVAVDKDFYAFKAVDSNGNSDGLYCLQVCEVIKIETDSKYLKKMQKLHQELPCFDVDFGNDVLKAVINFVTDSHQLCYVGLFDQHVSCGYVTAQQDDKLYMDLVDDEYGDDDGKCVVYTSDVAFVEVSSVELKTLAKLR